MKKVLLVAAVLSGGIGLGYLAYRLKRAYKGRTAILESGSIIVPDGSKDVIEGQLEPFNDVLAPERQIVKETIQYRGGDSDAVPPKGIWSDDMPYIYGGEYLWAKKTTQYSEGPDSVVFSRCQHIDSDSEYAEEESEEEDEHLKAGIDPNSVTAFNEYKHMLTADVISTKTNNVLNELWRIEYKPIMEKDELIADHILGRRIAFFGPAGSCYINEAPTMAEFFLHFAELLDYDISRGVDYWLTVLFTNMGLYDVEDVLEYNHIFTELMDHDYHGQRGWGMFALHSRDAGWMAPSFMQQYWGSPYLDLEDDDEDEDEEDYDDQDGSTLI